MKTFALFLAAFAFIPVSEALAQQNPPKPYATMAPTGKYLIANVKDEIAMARTAAPPSISAGAEVLVLTPHGYVTAVKGGNGFVCFVMRSWFSPFGDPEFWNPRERGPNCYNSHAVRSVLPEDLQRTKWVLAGASEQQLIEKTKDAVARHIFRDPEEGSFSFMLSKRGYLNDNVAGPWLPHVMFFVPHGQAAVWAAGLKASPVRGRDGMAMEATTLFIPVPRWSDGSPAPLP